MAAKWVRQFHALRLLTRQRSSYSPSFRPAPKHLSDSEKQRFALARALASSPKALLLDEPMSGLDLETANFLRSELKQLKRRLGVTTVYVCNSQPRVSLGNGRQDIIIEGDTFKKQVSLKRCLLVQVKKKLSA